MNTVLERARLLQKCWDDGREYEAIEVHFNPDTLSQSISSQIKGSDGERKQYTATTSGKLSMELIFDTTHSGEDVRLHTNKVARLMQPREGQKPPLVIFEWGVMRFTGLVDGFREKLEFFAPEGIPLRASVSLSLTRHDKEKLFAIEQAGGRRKPRQKEVAVKGGAEEQRGLQAVADKGGAPGATRDIAARNGIENIRFPGRRKIVVDDAPPAASKHGGRGGRRDLALEASEPCERDKTAGQEAPAGGQRIDVGSVGALKDAITFEGGE